jgi:hypothetical protein
LAAELFGSAFTQQARLLRERNQLFELHSQGWAIRNNLRPSTCVDPGKQTFLLRFEAERSSIGCLEVTHSHPNLATKGTWDTSS